MPFLDILIKINKSGIWMDFYHKHTDMQRCLLYISSHPNHCKQNNPLLYSAKDLHYCRKQCREVKEFRKLKIKFIKILLPIITNETRISEGSFNTTKSLTNVCISKTKLRDRVRVYLQQVRQRQYQQLKGEGC